MVFITNKIFGKVWKVTPSDNGKYIDLQMNTSEKKQDGTYENSRWFPRVIGHALNSLKVIKEGDKIIITKAKMENLSKKDEEGNWKSGFKFLILEAEIDGKENNNTETASPQPEENSVEQGGDETCPW